MTSSEEIALRRATLEDAETIAKHRRAMFCDMGYLDQAALHSMMTRFLPWLEAKMQSGDYLGWLAVTRDDLVAAGAGLWLMDWPPHMVGCSPRRGNIVNVYTEPAFRRRGLARRLANNVAVVQGKRNRLCDLARQPGRSHSLRVFGLPARKRNADKAVTHQPIPSDKVLAPKIRKARL